MKKIFLLFLVLQITAALMAQNSVSFTVNSTDQCITGNSFQFTNTSSGNLTFKWDFSDNTSATSTSAIKSYSEAKDYNVTLIGTDTAGINYYYAKKITVHPLPIMNFAVYNGGVVGSTFNFISTASITAGYIATHNWSFGDGSTDSGSNVNKAFSNTGNYAVTLTGISAAGCSSSITQNIVVTPTPPTNGGSITPPNNTKASFAVNDTTQCFTGNSFEFTNTTSGSFTYKWYFGDGDSSTNTNPTKAYTASGDYNVTLVATDAAGIKYYHSVKVTVAAMPVMDFNVYPSAVNGTGYTFTSTSSIAAGNIETFNWNFGDGSIASGQNPYKEYLTIGTFNVSLQGISNQGCSTSVTKPVVINKSNVARVPATFTINDSLQCITGNSFTYTNTTPINGDEVYAWDLGNGTTATTRNAAITYANAGHYIVKLTVIRNSDTSSTTQQVTVYPKPIVGFKILEKQSNGNAYTFIDTSTIAFGNVTYLWDLGDGTTSTLSNPTREYAGAGTTYTIKLKVTNTEGCSDSVSQTITTCPKIATTSFNIQQHNVCENGNRFSFTNSSSATTTGGSLVSYQWLLGDGTAATTLDVLNKSYDSAKDYNVKLIVTNTLGTCTVKDSLSKTITVFPKPKVGYVVYLNTALQNLVPGEIIKLCTTGNTPGGGHDFQFISNASIKRGQMLYNWDFGTNNLTFREGNNTFVNPRIIFQENGTFPVKLKVTSLEGCTDSFSHSFSVIDIPTPIITVTDLRTDDTELPTLSAKYINSPSNLGGLTYAWSTNAIDNNGYVSTNTLQEFKFLRQLYGTNQTVSLNLSAGAGCTINTTKTFVALIRPKISTLSVGRYIFDAIGRPIFYNAASGYLSSFSTAISLNSTLDFGDGTKSILNSNSIFNSITQFPNHTYSSSVADSVRYTVKNNEGGLIAYQSKAVNVYAVPLAQIGLRIVPRAVASGADMVYFKDLSSIAFGSLFSHTRTFKIQISGGVMLVDTTIVFLPGDTTLDITPFALNIPASTSFSISMQLTYSHPTNTYDGRNLAFGFYSSFFGSGSGYTAFRSSGNNPNPSVILVNANGVSGTTSIPNVPFTIHPNPATSFVNVTYAPGKTKEVVINVYNSLGSLVSTQQQTVVLAATQTTRVNVSALAKGMYRIEVLTKEGKRIGMQQVLVQ